jgi:hypothetical protein
LREILTELARKISNSPDYFCRVFGNMKAQADVELVKTGLEVSESEAIELL